jgi:peptidyl-prolyl cis-trans isomerase D
MSVIQTIRNKYGKIAGGIIAVALIGFIISDARNGTFGNLFGGHETTVMTINGNKIEPKEYQVRLKEFETLYTMFNRNRNLDDASRAQMNEQSIQMMVYDEVVNEQCDKLGIRTTEEEIKDLIYGANAHQWIREFQIEGRKIFINEQGQFDPQIIKAMEKELAEQPQRVDPTGKVREQWEALKSYVKRMNRIDKFNQLFTGSVYIPSFMAARSFADQNSMASIRYVKIPLTAVPDNEIKVTDDDVNTYMQKHKGLFETDQPTRSIEYVSFDINPASADTARALEALEQIKSDFATTKDNKSFVNNKSDEANSYDEAYENKRTFMSRYADTLMVLPVETIYGPYYENGSYKLTKIIDRKTLPDSAKIRHILVKTKAQETETLPDSLGKQRIDSVVALIKGGANFDSVAARFSDDDGSKNKGGEYTFTLQQRPGIDSAFGDFAFEGKPGETKVVKAHNGGYSGYHYIEILEQKGIAPAVLSATVTKNLAPSDSTVNGIYGLANEFAGKNATAEAFDAAIKKQGLDKRIGDNVKENNFTITGLGPAREVVKWMYEHKVGEVSQVFQLGEQRYVVAKLSAVQEKGVAALTPTSRQMLEQRIRDEKKAEIISKKYTGSNSLESLAQTSGQQVMQADSVILGGGYVPNLGYEPKVVGYTFCKTFQPNTVSPGIKGLSAVYFISVLNRNAPTINPAEPQVMQMLARQRGMQEGQLRNTVGQAMQQAMTKKANVKYNVSNF